MPPRRSRRRKSGNYKQPLHFLESPLHLVHKLPSPVFPSDHPAQAEVIPAELGTSVWVSPQFRNVPPSGVKPKRSRQTQRSGPRTENGGGEGEIGHTRTQGANVKKYMPLQMLGEVDNNSVCEDIEENSSPKRRTRSGSNRNSSIIRRRSTPKEQGLRSKQNQDPSDLTGGNDSGRKFTQVRPKNDRKTKRSKLTFSNSSSDSELNGSPERPNVNGTPLGNQDSFVGGDFDSVHTPVAHCYPSPADISRARKSCLFSRLLDETKLSESSDDCPKVLVYDTPESEYGKDMRWRQLHKRSKRTKTKSRLS